jgi:AAA domain
MSDSVFQSLAQARSGFVEAAAGCGKTEAIVRTVGAYCEGCQLVLTHTHAGVDALRQRFRLLGVSHSKYHVDTIAGWAWGWVRMYPSNGNYQDAVNVTEWANVYQAMCNLLHKDFVRHGILNSYAGVIVDEYQDCTKSMHALMLELKKLLPCRVLGDDLQGVFGFRDELVSWSDVRAAFKNELGLLDRPHRWIKAGNENLGLWLQSSRSDFRDGREPTYRGSPIDYRSMNYGELSKVLTGILHQKQGRMCIIGPKARRLPASVETSLVKQKFSVLEPNDLTVLRKLVRSLCEGSATEKSKAAMEFVEAVFGGLNGDEKRFIEALFYNKVQNPKRADRRAMCAKHQQGVTSHLLSDLLAYVSDGLGKPTKLNESVSALKCILEANLSEGSADFNALYANEIARRKYYSRSHIYRCVGSTLLVKGLEFDHAIVLRSPGWQQSWGTHKDLYVALTRGAKSTVLVDLKN